MGVVCVSARMWGGSRERARALIWANFGKRGCFGFGLSGNDGHRDPALGFGVVVAYSSPWTTSVSHSPLNSSVAACSAVILELLRPELGLRPLRPASTIAVAINWEGTI